MRCFFLLQPLHDLVGGARVADEQDQGEQADDDRDPAIGELVEEAV
jgi:hypothetical protein